MYERHTFSFFFFSESCPKHAFMFSKTDRQTDRRAHTHRYAECPVGNLSHSHTHSLTLSFSFSLCCFFFSAVRFHDCGRGGRVHFECSQPTGFRIEITGEALALWKLQPSLSSSSSFSSSPLLVIARDVSTHEQWQTQIRLGPSGGHESQV